MCQGSLRFPQDNELSSAAKAPAPCFLVTNHLNLMYMLAAGLVMPPAGFGKKYYRDTLGCFPGWIPLFIGKVFKGAIELSTREAGHLRPVIVQIRLSDLKGEVKMLDDRGVRELHFPDRLEGNEQAILVPAPLPTSWIESVFFRSAEERRACDADAKNFGNVPLQDFERKTKVPLFAKAPDTPWPPVQGPAERGTPLQAALAAGGVMAMLLQVANKGERAVQVCRRAFGPEGDAAPPMDEMIFSGLDAWMRTGKVQLTVTAGAESDRANAQRAFQKDLFWGVLERLVDWKNDSDSSSARDVVLDYLDVASQKLDGQLQAGTRELYDNLVSLTGLAGATATELFERHATQLARAMVLFFLRRNCTELLDFRNDKLGELDWLVAAILFGVRESWLGLPLELRSMPGLSSAVSHRMARMAHRIAGTNLSLGDSPARIRPLRELLGGSSTWRSREKKAAVAIAREQKWDCISTRISLGRGAYRLRVEGGSVHIMHPGAPKAAPSEVDRGRVLDTRVVSLVRGAYELKVEGSSIHIVQSGEPKSVTAEVDRARFLDYLASVRIDPKTEAKARKALGA